MQMHSLKKVGVWLTLATLTTMGIAHAESLADRRGSHHSGKHHSGSHHSGKHHSGSHSSHRCVPSASSCGILEPGEANLRKIVGNLDRIFLAEALTGSTPADPVIASYVNAANAAPTGSITSESSAFGAFLVRLGVDQSLANQVVTALNAYAIAAENFSATFVSGGDIGGALAFWEAQGDALSQALANASGVKVRKLTALVNDLIATQVVIIQAYNAQNFNLGVEEYAHSIDVAVAISHLVGSKLIKDCQE